ncbi:MAG TPA: hypothetical protein VJB96_05790 [Patescibacteria group bacterium]|nr:hypothetical protein [Patescibacteria group bacterium]
MSTALAVIQFNALYLYYSDRPGPVGGSIPKAAISDMEVVSDVELTRVVSKLIAGNSRAPVNTVLAISDDQCFALPQRKDKEEDIEKRLVDLIPFSQIASVKVAAANESYIVATNQDLYESYARALSVVHHPVVLVIPWMTLLQTGISKGEVDSVTVKRVFDSFPSLRSHAYPLRIENNEAQPPSGEKVAHKPTKLSWGWIVFGGIALLYALGMFWFFIRS